MATPPTLKYTNKLAGKRVLIFGGTSGIGYAVAEACVEHGCAVILSASSPAGLASTALCLHRAYPHLLASPAAVVTHACDLSRPDALEPSLETLLDVVTRGGRDRLDHVVFAAGDRRARVTVADVTPGALAGNSTVRVVAPVMLAKCLARRPPGGGGDGDGASYMAPGPGSSLTLTGGFLATKPPPGFGLHAASALEGLARGLAVDMAPVRVNLVAPGAVLTEAMAGVPQGALDHLTKQTLTGRLGRPEDIAEAYLYCMRDGYVTGSILHSNGGTFLV